LDDARKEISDLLNVCRSSGGAGKFMVPLFFIDEVPAADGPEDNDSYNSCIFLRNIIRSMDCICLLSGTEAAAMNAIDKIGRGSRSDTKRNREYIRLILKLPRTQWEIFSNDDKYANLIPLVTPDVCDMLKCTRPLFAQYVLDAMLEEQNTSAFSYAKITPAVLSRVKEMIKVDKGKFARPEGLYGQMSLLQSDFVASSEDMLKFASKKKYSDKILQRLKSQQQFIVRHHFGTMRVSGCDSTIMSLFIAPNITKVCVNVSGELEVFTPTITFDSPSQDPLLYMICFRDGASWVKESQKIVRVSTSFALSKIYGNTRKLLLNSKQTSTSGKFLELETVLSAVITASHSYPNSLTGCPLEFFLCAMIAELNHNEEYTSFAGVENMPGGYKGIRVGGLLSPANANWRNSEESIFKLQCDTISLCSFIWSSNMGRNDGTYPLLTSAGLVAKASSEVKCYRDKVPTAELMKTIYNTIKNDNLITIMVVTNFVDINLSNSVFDSVTEEINVFMIRGNANTNYEVATELQFEPVHVCKDCSNVPIRTVIIINLSSIFYGRYDCMKALYQST